MLCQTITLPITIFASLGYTYGLDLDWRLVGGLSLSATLGVVLGIAIAPRIRVPALARIVSIRRAPQVRRRECFWSWRPSVQAG
jgi:hypothetical protein